jgi:uncharacterized protein (TIRG00374 family)
MPRKLFAVLKYLIFISIGVFLVWWQFDKMTAEQRVTFWRAIQQVHLPIIVPIVLMSLASHYSRALRWRLLIEPLGHALPSKVDTFGVTMVGYLANTFVPRLGEILKCTQLSRYAKIPAHQLIGTIVVERIFDFVCYLLFIAITLLMQYPLVGSFVEAKLAAMRVTGSGWWIKLALVVALLAGIWFLLRWVLHRYAEATWAKVAQRYVKGVRDGLISIFRLKRRRAFFGHTLFIWAMYLLQIYVGFQAIDAVSHLSMHAAFGVLTLATLAMIVTPGGLGTFPTAVYLVLELYGVEPVFGEAFGWLVWGMNTSIVLVVGGGFALWFSWRGRKA